MSKKQARLPVMEDSEVEALEDLAEEYAEIRDRRMELNQTEHDLKGKLLSEMKRRKKSRYYRDGIEIRVVVEEETVKVRVKKEAKEE